MCFQTFLYFPRYYCVPENETLGHPDLQAGYDNCPAGYFCPEGTGLDWVPCPAGTYSDQENLYKVCILVLLVNVIVRVLMFTYQIILAKRTADLTVKIY